MIFSHQIRRYPETLERQLIGGACVSSRNCLSTDPPQSRKAHGHSGCTRKFPFRSFHRLSNGCVTRRFLISRNFIYSCPIPRLLILCTYSLIILLLAYPRLPHSCPFPRVYQIAGYVFPCATMIIRRSDFSSNPISNIFRLFVRSIKIIAITFSESHVSQVQVIDLV